MTPRRGTPALLGLNAGLLALALFAFGGARRAPAPAPLLARTVAPSGLALQWVRDLPVLRPAWPDQPRLQFDAAYRLVVHGDTLLLASSRTDSVTAYDADTGARKWRRTVDGPVRFAPVVGEGRVYFVSDDGHLYCVALADGALLWKFRGGPSDRKILGNGRLISTWPARGAPAVADGTVYFAAGIWPFMGVFVHALDARTGAVVWTSDGDGSTYRLQPHYADAFGGVAPQGTLVVAGDKLLVPGGRSVPACYDRRTGKLLHFQLAENSKLGGGFDVAAAGGLFVNGGGLFDVATGDFLSSVGERAVLTPDTLYSCTDRECEVLDIRGRPEKKGTLDRLGRYSFAPRWSPPKVATVPLTGVAALTLAGDRLYVGTAGQVAALRLPLRDGPAKAAWHVPVQGTPAHIVADGGRLFVSTREGQVYCFGPAPTGARSASKGGRHLARDDDSPCLHGGLVPEAQRARNLLAAADVRDGYGVVWGAGDGRLVHELIKQSNLHVLVVEPDAEKVEKLRGELIAAGLHGERAAIVPGDWKSVELPPYFASLMVMADAPADEAFVRKAYHSLRPYGGVACLPAAAKVDEADLPRAWVRKADAWLLLSREGALPGAADWTHENADAANTRVSRDSTVMAPLGVLWFGGPPHHGMLPRHGHGPQPQVVDGRLIIEGVDLLRAVDIYTGRLLWETRLPGVGHAFDNTWHQPGANASGGNYVSTADGIYVAYGKSCLRLDPATGKRLAEFHQPPLGNSRGAAEWSFVSVCGPYLIAGANPPADAKEKRDAVSSSQRLVVLDRHTGALRWGVTADSGFRHHAICAGGGRLFYIDRPSDDYLYSLKRFGTKPSSKPRVRAFDLETGAVVWSCDDEVFGTWLAYSEKLGVLVEAGRVARDSLYDEPSGVRAYCADNGTVLWHRGDYTGPALIHGATVLTHHGACDLRTGAPVLRHDPLTGEPAEWAWTRGYGCNTPAASQHLLTFRSGAAGYYDLARDGGTGNFGGFRSGCTNNLVVAGGVLSAPDYTRTCTCSYQNQTSLALVPMPDAEMWTYFGSSSVKGPVRRVGLNLGAAGSRKADDGTLWLEYPPAGGPSPRLKVTTVPEKPEWFRHHSSRFGGAGPAWVASSGVKGLRSLTVALGSETDAERTYTVRLHFAEPEERAPGERVFDVALQGTTVLRDLDVCREAGGPRRGVVKEFRGVRVTAELTVTLTPAGAAPVCAPVLCGVEVVAED